MSRHILLIAILMVAAHGNSHAQAIADSLLHQGRVRRYMLHTPPGFGDGQPRALVVNLHGGSGTMVNVQGFSLMNPVADAYNFVVCYPQGFGIAPPGYSWADGRNTSADRAGVDDVGFLTELVKELLRRYAIDDRRIYLCGFSNGGFMVQRVACEAPGMFAAMASLGSSMDTVLYSTCRPIRSMPMVFMNGTSDPAMPYEGGPMQNPLVTPVVPVDSTVQRWVRSNGCNTRGVVEQIPDIDRSDSSTVERHHYTNCDCGADVVLYRIKNGGHTWPGVRVEGQSEILGGTNMDISGSDELWRFFRQFELCDGETRVTERAPDDVRLYPSPVGAHLSVKGVTASDAVVRIFDGLGRELLTVRGQTTLDVSGLPGGVYVVRVEFEGQMRTTTLVKQH